MDAKVYLSRAWIIEQQVRSKMQQIAALKSLAEKVTGGFGSEPVSHTRNVTAMQDSVVRILEAEEELNRKIDDLVAMKQEIADVIDRVEDDYQRLLLEKRYLLFMSWEEVEAELHYSKRWVQNCHRDALDAVQGILEGSG